MFAAVGAITKKPPNSWMKILGILFVFFMLSGCCDDHGSGTATTSAPESPGGWGGEECRADTYVRYGDYLSTQMVTNRTFGYGMFVCEFQAADGPTCSTFWLYANEPSVRNLPDVAQNWRWDEIDFEFVPFTEATQSQYYTFDGGHPKPAVRAFGTTLNFGDPRSQTLEDEAVSWTEGKIQTDETIARDMWIYYNTWMTPGNGGPPTGGHFTLTDGSSNAVTGSLDWNASADQIKTALDALNDSRGLFNLKGHYTVSTAAQGGKGDILAGSLTVIRNIDPGLIPQLSTGETVHSAEDATIIAAGTTIFSVDTSAQTVTLSQAATKAVTGQTFNFVPVGSWSITFTGTSPDPSDALIIDYASLEPEGTLGKIVVGKDSGGAVLALSISVFQPFMRPGSGRNWWELLKDETGEGKLWPNAQTWKFPLVHIETPDTCDMKKMVTLNFWRSPEGNESADIDFGGWGKVTHKGILRERPIPGTASHPTSFTSAVLNNEAYVFDTTGTYNPTGSIHTYTIVWTPTRMAQYIDAPNRGRDISNAAPIAEYRIADFPSLDHSGPQAEGAAIPWIGTELNQPIGNVTMNVANYVAFRAASTGTNQYAWATGDLSATDAVVRNVAFQEGANLVPVKDLVGKGITGQGIPPGTTVLSVDETGKTLTMSKAATASATGSCITLGQEVFPLNITKDNAIIKGFNIEKGKLVSDEVAVGQIILGDGIPDGATVKDIDEVQKTAIMTLGATKTLNNTYLIFQTAPSGSGWSGPPPAADFTGADAYIRSVGFFPLTSQGGDGTASSDFLTETSDPDVFWLDFSDGTWTADNFNTRITKYFGILYAQDFTSTGAIPGKSPLRDAKSPLNVTYQALADGHGAMRLRCSLSQDNPIRNFFVLQPQQVKDGEIGTENKLVRAEITSKDDDNLYYAASSSVTTPNAFYAPPPGKNVTVQVKVWVDVKGYYDPDAGGNPVTLNPDHVAEILLKTDDAGNVSWETTQDPDGVIEAFQAANPHLITVKAPGTT